MSGALKSLFRPDRARVQAVDGLRALSICWVFVHHVVIVMAASVGPDAVAGVASLPGYRWALHGYFGVDVFFVISGRRRTS